MTREELKKHCQKQIEGCEMWARCKGEEPHGKIYEEHKLILELLEQEPVLDKIRAEIWDLQYGDEEKSMTDEDRADAYNNAIRQVIEIIDKYKSKIDPHESEDNDAEDSN